MAKSKFDFISNLPSVFPFWHFWMPNEIQTYPYRCDLVGGVCIVLLIVSPH